MDNDYKENTSKDGVKTWSKEISYEDGSSTSTRIEKVDNGYIQTITSSKKTEDSYDFDSKKTIHTENPLEEKSLVDKLAEILKL